MWHKLTWSEQESPKARQGKLYSQVPWVVRKSYHYNKVEYYIFNIPKGFLLPSVTVLIILQIKNRKKKKKKNLQNMVWVRRTGGIGINYEVCCKVFYSANFHFLSQPLPVSLSLSFIFMNLIWMFLSVKGEEKKLAFNYTEAWRQLLSCSTCVHYKFSLSLQQISVNLLYTLLRRWYISFLIHGIYFPDIVQNLSLSSLNTHIHASYHFSSSFINTNGK